MKAFCFILLGMVPLIIQAQDSFTAAGGQASGSAGTVSYSLGQLFFQTHSSDQGSVAEGVQHPYEIFVVFVAEQKHPACLEISLWPNPVKDQLNLRVTSSEDLSFQLLCAAGVVLIKGDVHEGLGSLSFSALSPGVYFLTFFRHQYALKTFQIIKSP